jgi:phosphopantothenoylcysteine decarboxylase/phosphopantothenate--cysteine ligase
LIEFSTNTNLLERLHALSTAGTGAVFHAAALCDYEVKSIRTTEGDLMTARKIPTLAGELVLTLRPARKILPVLPGLFPGARIVGWKYELNGTHEAAVTKAREQIAANETNACVVNGAAWGAGFGFIEPGREPFALTDKPALCSFLARWLEREK